jgi:hypothetical protein
MFIFGPFATWLPILFFWAVLCYAALRYAMRSKPDVLRKFFSGFTFLRLAVLAAAFRIGYAIFLTFGQYYIWTQNSFTRTFLHASVSPSLPIWLTRTFPWVFDTSAGYFIFYSWGRFWMNAVLGLCAALLWWWFLRALRRRNERFFEEGEVELGFLSALIVGWPNIVLFVPLSFLAVVLVSVFRMAVLKRTLTTLGWSFLLAALATLAFGSALLDMVGFTVLKV